jgi:hypothetical protein
MIGSNEPVLETPNPARRLRLALRGLETSKSGEPNWMRIAKSDVEGGLAINTKVKVPSIKAKLTSSYIDLSDFKGLYGGRPETPLPPAASSANVIPNQPIGFTNCPMSTPISASTGHGSNPQAGCLSTRWRSGCG